MLLRALYEDAPTQQVQAQQAAKRKKDAERDATRQQREADKRREAAHDAIESAQKNAEERDRSQERKDRERAQAKRETERASAIRAQEMDAKKGVKLQRQQLRVAERRQLRGTPTSSSGGPMVSPAPVIAPTQQAHLKSAFRSVPQPTRTGKRGLDGLPLVARHALYARHGWECCQDVQ
jgi:hypothetical protein